MESKVFHWRNPVDECIDASLSSLRLGMAAFRAAGKERDLPPLPRRSAGLFELRQLRSARRPTMPRSPRRTRLRQGGREFLRILRVCAPGICARGKIRPARVGRPGSVEKTFRRLTAYCVVAARSMPLVAADVSRLIPFPFAFICPRMAKVRADSRPLLQAAACPGNFRHSRADESKRKRDE